MIAYLYECSHCGDVWHVVDVEIIDVNNDEVYTIKCCEECNREVSLKVTPDGLPCCRALTEEEMFWEMCGGDW